MKILYVSCLCSKEKFARIFEGSGVKPGQQVQKYHGLLAGGFVQNGAEVTALSALPVTDRVSGHFYYRCDKEAGVGINYIYAPFVNAPVLRQISLLLYCFFYAFAWFRKNHSGTMVCDILSMTAASAAVAAAKILRRKCAGIVTDVPSILTRSNSRKGPGKLFESIMAGFGTKVINGCGSYVLLTAQMDVLVNPNHRPFTVIEGLTDIDMKNVPNLLENKYEKKVCIYAGSLHRKYGIGTLTEAFVKADVAGSELHIYGDGDYTEKVKKACREYRNIKYFGILPNERIVAEQLKASLLINPRPSWEEFTKYSFPSKNMEYMASGTPLLCTALPGMPKEYMDYVYIADDESVEGFASKLRGLLSLDSEKLHSFGMRAKGFVLENKNNIVQAGKVIRMLERADWD